jgi:hypothetical protein
MQSAQPGSEQTSAAARSVDQDRAVALLFDARPPADGMGDARPAYCAVKVKRPLGPTLVSLAVESTPIVPLPPAATEPEYSASR